MAAINLALTGATFDTTGKKFGAGALSGGYGSAASAVMAASGSWTVEAWVKTSVNNAVKVAVGEALYFYFGTDASGNAKGNYGTGYIDVTSTTPIADGAWHHLELSYDSSTGVARLFVDGVLAGSHTAGSVFDNTSNPFTVHEFGGYVGSGYAWSGDVDEVAVWSAVRHTAAFTPPTSAYVGNETNLTHLYHLDSDGSDSFGSTGSSAATAYTLTGPTSGSTGSASSNFTVTSNGTLASAVTVTPSSGGGGGTFTPATVTLAAGANTSATFTYTPASTGTKTISTTNNGSLTNPSSISYVVSSGPVAIAPNNTALAYSPSNWSVTSGSAKTLNAGAYFRAGFTGASCTLNFDVSALTGNLPQIWYSIDGNPKVQATLAATIACTMPSDTTAWGTHTVEVWVKSITAGGTRWPGAAATVSFTGLTLASGASAVALVSAAPKTILTFGDSITEGYKTRNASAANDTDQNDGTLSLAYQIGRLLGAEVGVIGFGGQGVTVAGDAGVPAFPSAYNLIIPGVTRTFSPEPDLILINQGTNDAVKTSNTTTVRDGLVTVVNAILAATTNTKIVLMQTLGDYLTSYIQAAVSTVNNSRCTYLSTAGLLAAGDLADSYHPTGGANLSKLAPTIAAGLRPLLYGPAGANLVSSVLASDLVTLYRSGAAQTVLASDLKAYLASA